MRKISLFLAIVMILCALPLTALAVELVQGQDGNTGPTGILEIDMDAKIGAMGNTYGNGFAPRVRMSSSGTGSVQIDLPLIINPAVKGAIKVSLDAEASPAVISNNSVRTCEVVKVGTDPNQRDIWATSFNLKVKSGTVDGSYPVTLICKYETEEGSVEQPFTIYFEVYGNDPNATPEPEPTQAPETPTSIPRLMVTKYTINPTEVLAGGEFELTLEIKNQSKRTAQNVELTIKSADATFLPKDGTNTAFFSSIKGGATKEQKFTFNVKPDAEPAPSMLTVELAYEDAKLQQGTETAEISIPVTQPIRIRIDEPKVYGDMIDQPFTVSMSIYNLGKSTLYNVLAEIEGNDIIPDGSYYGGNLEPGGSKTIELTASVIPPEPEYSEPSPGDGMEGSDPMAGNAVVGGYGVASADMYYGDMGMGGEMVNYQAKIKLSYEDANGKPYTEEKSCSVDLQNYIMDPGIDDPAFNPEEPIYNEPANLTWLWITLGVLAVAGGAVFLVLRMKKRKRMIEDELL